MKTLLQIIVFLCIFLFVYTALSKLIALEKFEAQIRTAPLIGTYATIVIWATPLTELVVAALIMVPQTRVLGLQLFLGLLSVFTAYIIYIIFHAPHIPCACGGVLEEMGWGDHLLFNLLFIALGIAGWRLSRNFSGRTRGKQKTCRKEYADSLSF